MCGKKRLSNPRSFLIRVQCGIYVSNIMYFIISFHGHRINEGLSILVKRRRCCSMALWIMSVLIQTRTAKEVGGGGGGSGGLWCSSTWDGDGGGTGSQYFNKSSHVNVDITSSGWIPVWSLRSLIVI